jgi:hypothetical protein
VFEVQEPVTTRMNSFILLRPLTPETSYETLHSKVVWERFVLVLASHCFSSGATAIKWIEFLYSMFDVGRSMFDVNSFLLSVKLAAPRPAAPLTPETN